MKKKSLVLSFLFVASFSFSQVAGYMGKRFVIAYDNYFFPAIKGPGLTNAAPSSEFSPGLNNVNCLNLDYTIKQRVNFCISLQYMRTGIAYRKGSITGSSSGAYPNETYSSNSNNSFTSIHSIYDGDFSTPAVLSSVNIGGGIKIFNHGCIAPVGKYVKFEILIFNETVVYDSEHFYVTDYPTSSQVKVKQGAGTYNYRNFALTFTKGTQRVFFNKIVLDYGFRFGLVPAGFTTFLFNGLDSSDSKSMEQDFKIHATYRIFREQLLNLHIGIGFLAF